MRKYKVDEETFIKIKKTFGSYVFNRKDENGCFVKLDRKQQRICEGMNLKLEEL